MMVNELKMYYTPQWKDGDGNVFITLGVKDMFEDEQTARTILEAYPRTLKILSLMGIELDGVYEFYAGDLLTDGAKFPHVKGTHSLLGDVAIIGGPMYDLAATNGDNPEPTHDAPERLQ